MQEYRENFICLGVAYFFCFKGNFFVQVFSYRIPKYCFHSSAFNAFLHFFKLSRNTASSDCFFWMSASKRSISFSACSLSVGSSASCSIFQLFRSFLSAV